MNILEAATTNTISKISAKLLKYLEIYGLTIMGFELQALTNPKNKQSECKVCMLFFQLFWGEHLHWQVPEHDIQKQVCADTRISNEGGKMIGREIPVVRVKMEANTV